MAFHESEVTLRSLPRPVAFFGDGVDRSARARRMVGVQYQYTGQQSIHLGLLYQHFSNGGLSEPERPSIGPNTLGPLLGWDITF